ncbi:30S ribosomal protein S20 [Campylobacter canadensis]|uniref:Small ribosomal subunit protein bS20 n=1 Tax=Campylobacter canadensis TaxID=449520 RepID=A0ABS7WUF8_9BACT|nr:30S ribosomal protein S20 [Campylobacter canadensis]MBZ7988026.1 30S ribosomal protein S20 [Campylobacter canadensis]MBZ7995460.1 30S ribosomal protein S20 [Campylobacter canadensis]MBZ7996567.1 30S ribosomal protein S20 [Campylobacter canadensis]MBZ7998989.1 30S ribosomal protein S20 [Campylobacter canadensis]MBZ8000761.1 30S ribosomal protein S20 [Campylobacter canadensis]
MANHKSSEKRARQTIKKTIRNRFYKTRLKNVTRAVREAAASNDAAKAAEALKIANKKIHEMVSRGVLKKQTASRKVSRLALLVNKIGA